MRNFSEPLVIEVLKSEGCVAIREHQKFVVKDFPIFSKDFRVKSSQIEDLYNHEKLVIYPFGCKMTVRLVRMSELSRGFNAKIFLQGKQYRFF